VLVNDGKDPAADRKAERTSGTFGELAILYRDHAKKKNKSWAQPMRWSCGTCCHDGASYDPPTSRDQMSRP
jgi:hypothetical protein